METMKTLRRLFRLGTLTLLALALMTALALPASAADVCSSSQMLDEVDIVSVAAKESPAVWTPQGLVNFDYGGDIENGLLEVSFKDIATDFDFDGYIITATPGNDDPGDSAELGVKAYTSPELLARPAIVGSTVTEVLNLEPGTKYYVTVHAVNHNTVQISPKQRAQDSAQSSATTLLSAPFLGAMQHAFLTHVESPGGSGNWVLALPFGSLIPCTDLTILNCRSNWQPVGLNDDDYKGAHFALYGVENEAGQHYFRWLNPHRYGPFDHLLDEDHNPALDADHQADMLSLDKDGKLEDHCADADITDGNCGHTHYQFKAMDENGNVVASELVETHDSNGASEFGPTTTEYFQTVFTAEEGELTLSVSLGRKVDGKYKAMSDTASVTFEAPDDLRALDQTYDEYRRVLHDITGNVDTGITGDYDENEDLERWLGENDTGDGRSLWNPDTVVPFNSLGRRDVMKAHLNNQLK